MSDSIKASIQKQSKDDPKKFAETIVKLRKERPELKSQDDVTAAMSVAFSVVKSDSQKRFTDLYNKSVANAQKTIDPNLDQESLKVLSASPKGKEYLNMIADFNNKLKSGQSQMSNVKTQTV
jgi:ribosomal protein L22